MLCRISRPACVVATALFANDVSCAVIVLSPVIDWATKWRLSAYF